MSAIDLEKTGGYAKETVLEVLETMVGIAGVEATEPTLSDGPPPETELTGLIGLAGGLKGAVAIQGPSALGREIAAQMLCVDDPSELEDDDVRDAFGEVANMVAGGIKTRLEGDGHSFGIAVPVVVLAPESIGVQYRLVSEMVTVNVKCPTDVLQVVFSIATAD